MRRHQRNHYKARQLLGKLALVDLAGSERAAETNNIGHKLRDGANINRSLLSLANCIHQLGKGGAAAAAGGGRTYVPYRNSKLTRLLKDGLEGNSRTVMVATVAAASDQYHHSINTLKYANRAKDIKTHIVQNVASVESHVADYRRIIDNLQVRPGGHGRGGARLACMNGCTRAGRVSTVFRCAFTLSGTCAWEGRVD